VAWVGDLYQGQPWHRHHCHRRCCIKKQRMVNWLLCQNDHGELTYGDWKRQNDILSSQVPMTSQTRLHLRDSEPLALKFYAQMRNIDEQKEVNL